MLRKKHLSMLGLLVGLITLWSAIHWLLRRSPAEGAFMIAHRGAAGLAPENTIASLREALARGATHVEVDVQRTADHVLVLMHDETVDRTTNGSGPVSSFTWKELAALDAGRRYAPEFAGEPVPALAGVFELLAEQPATLVLEVKNPALYPGIKQELVQTINRFEAAGRVIVVSFDHNWLADLSALAPHIRTGYLYAASPLRSPTSRPGVVSVLWTSALLDPTLIWRMRRQGQQLWVWTVNNPALIRLLLWLGVNGVTTDRPDLYRLPLKRA